MPTPPEYRQFEIPGHIGFKKSENSLTKIVIDNRFAEAEIYLHGANLTHFRLKGEEAVIYNGTETVYSADKTVHAGIPICWPWFGAHPTDSAKPQHGFARDMPWKPKSTKTVENGETEVVLILEETPESLQLWPYSFRLELTFTIGNSLRIELKTTNTAAEPFTITQALHSYFFIGDIEAVEARGVETTPFVDYTDDKKEKNETAPLRINRMVNRVYVPTETVCTIEDELLKRRIIIEKEGSRSTTIWNPWEKSGIHDLPGDTYRKFLCIETTNALSDARTLQPGKSGTIVQKITVQKY